MHSLNLWGHLLLIILYYSISHRRQFEISRSSYGLRGLRGKIGEESVGPIIPSDTSPFGVSSGK